MDNITWRKTRLESVPSTASPIRIRTIFIEFKIRREIRVWGHVDPTLVHIMAKRIQNPK